MYIKISKSIGTPIRGKFEKTIMLVGATGSGKTTLVDGIVNYVTGIRFDDPFRFTIVQPEEDNEETMINQVFHNVLELCIPCNMVNVKLCFCQGIH